MAIKRTTDRLPRTRYGTDGRVEFAQGERKTEADDETEQWAVETFDEIEWVTLEEQAVEVVTELDHPR